MNKQELRQFIRNEKRHLSQQQLREMALPIHERILNHKRVNEAEVILLYHALPDEVPTGIIISNLIEQGKTILLPKVISDTEMSIHRYRCPQDLIAGSFGIMEPSGEPFHGRIDLALIPGMAFDSQGHRLGRGKGYYDRFLSQHPYIYKIGVCFPFQFLDSIPNEATDIMMDDIIH